MIGASQIVVITLLCLAVLIFLSSCLLKPSLAVHTRLNYQHHDFFVGPRLIFAIPLYTTCETLSFTCNHVKEMLVIIPNQQVLQQRP